MVAAVAPLRRGKGGGAWPVRCRAVRGTRSGALLEPRRGGGCGSTVSRACRRQWHGRPSYARAGRAMALFIGARWRGGGSRRAGKWSTGVGAAGEGAARRVARRPSSWRAQERKGGVASSGERQESWFGANPGAWERFWAEARRVGWPGGFAGVRRRRGRGAGRRRWKNRSVAIP